MLTLLIKTRLKYYRNYIRYHFDRTTKIEIGLIVLVLVGLTLRSPADIGYNFQWMHSEKFPYHWASIFSIFLPICYILTEALAFHALRTFNEWQLLGALPFSRKSIANYYLFRHLSKTGILILIGGLPFLLALTCSLDIRVFRFLLASGMLLALQLSAFIQAHTLRSYSEHRWQKLTRWLFAEIAILGIIFGAASWSRFIFSISLYINWLGLLIIWIISLMMWVYIQKRYVLRDTERKLILEFKSTVKAPILSVVIFMDGFYKASIVNDILFLWRQKRSSFIVPLCVAIVASIISISADVSNAAFVGIIIIETIFSFLLITPALHIFEKDVSLIALIRSLPVKSTSLWYARWLLVAGFIGLPVLIPILIILVKFGINLMFIFFALITFIMIPAVIATLFCNACFGLFPQSKLSGYIIAISIILMFLFWFFMPFGSLMILAVIIFWIRKSQRHFHYLELS